MNAQRLIIAVLSLVALAIAGFLLLAPRLEPANALSGYIEGEPLYLAPPISGQLTNVAVARGQRVAAGDLVFTVDARSLTAERDAANGQVAQASSAITAAQSTLAQLIAQAAVAKANADEAAREAARAEALYAQGHGAIALQDAQRAQANAEAARAQQVAVQRQADAAGAQIGTAAGALGQAKGLRADAEAKLSQAAARAPAAARVEDVFYQTGEWAGANQPVVALLPDDRVRLRFFVPETEVAAYRIGRQVSFSCDGCPAGLVATINYVSPRPEFTPPVIYSLQSRDRLVFLVEALPSNPRGLTPGQPIDVAPLGPSR